MDFGIYPPEINSGRMYAGPGSGPLLAAAQAWATLADELYTAAGAYQSVVAGLTGRLWTGPAAASMAAAAASYSDWLGATAAVAEETATRASAAAGAYEAAFAMTAPPWEVTANRSLLAALVATNFFGQNTPAIAAAEAQYAAMWAQDAGAMYTYAASSAAATALTPPTSPRPTTSPGGPAGQAAAVTQALGTPGGSAQNVVSGVPQTLAAVPSVLQSLATPAQALPSATTLDTLASLITIFLSVPADIGALGVEVPLDILTGPVDLPFAVYGTYIGFHTDDIISGWNGEKSWPSTAPAPVQEFPATLTNPSPGTSSAALGAADTVGALSVPSAWTVAAPEVRPLALALPASGIDPVGAASTEAGSSTTISNMGLAGLTSTAGPQGGGGSAGGTVEGARVPARMGRAVGDGDRPPPPGTPRIVVTGVAAKIREITKLRDQGRLTDDEYDRLKNQLLGR
ncbi:PPE family protein, SVP subgroup [Mycobacterium bohemicum]|uniref:PPE family domain-containing protein n=1 Tax=Mycobacterium bohemicum TaxID=56425 RepID=A0A1X1R4B3_MYCBE|nr:PPE domain-containing protein [Mycobacterium bohemicum]MCV6968766.1 PPE domain-containing protein [Mycobacterium bohemicum]ORU99161.1 hypothetical protein AWB93_12085 [Mycobacterium bohemicum]